MFFRKAIIKIYFSSINVDFIIEVKASQPSEDVDDQMAYDWKGGGGQNGSQTITRSPKSSSAAPQMANIGKVKFHPPNVPVIFVLGGPGSGKVTHCDTLMQEKRGLTHINMMDLLQQYAMGNGECLSCIHIDFRQ